MLFWCARSVLGAPLPMPIANHLLTINGEPPAWDAFSKVNVNKLDPSEYEDEEEIAARKKKEETAQKAKPMSPTAGTLRPDSMS